MLFVSIAASHAVASAGERTDGAAIEGSTPPPQIYTIYNIAVDETARSSREASHNALTKAQRKGLEKLFRKIVRRDDLARIPPQSDYQVTELVAGLEVSNEKSSAVRYIADYTVHFQRDKIYELLSAHEIPFAETLSRPAHILTVLEQEGTTRLWEKDNVWRTAWQEFDTMNNLVPIAVIEPSYANRMALTPWQARAGDRALLDRFAEMRGVRKLYVMRAEVSRDIVTGKEFLEVTAFSNLEDGPLFNTTVVAETESDDVYRMAVDAATDWLDQQWKDKVMIRFGVSTRLSVTIQYESQADWLAIRNRLENISLIRHLKLVSLTTRAATAEIEHSGDLKQIILTLDQEQLKLSRPEQETEGLDHDSWLLTLKK